MHRPGIEPGPPARCFNEIGRRAFYHWTTDASVSCTLRWLIRLQLVGILGILPRKIQRQVKKKSPPPFKREEKKKNSYLVEKCSPMRGIEPRPRRWKRRILTTRPHGMTDWLLFPFPCFFSFPFSWAKKIKVPPRFELGLQDSESWVLTITPWDQLASSCNKTLLVSLPNLTVFVFENQVEVSCEISCSCGRVVKATD